MSIVRAGPKKERLGRLRALGGHLEAEDHHHDQQHRRGLDREQRARAQRDDQEAGDRRADGAREVDRNAVERHRLG
jgi:hypothetical protein